LKPDTVGLSYPPPLLLVRARTALGLMPAAKLVEGWSSMRLSKAFTSPLKFDAFRKVTDAKPLFLLMTEEMARFLLQFTIKF